MITALGWGNRGTARCGREQGDAHSQEQAGQGSGTAGDAGVMPRCVLCGTGWSPSFTLLLGPRKLTTQCLDSGAQGWFFPNYSDVSHTRSTTQSFCFPVHRWQSVTC